MESFHQEAGIRNFENLELLAAQVVEGFITGLHKSPFHGFSVEFAEHRSYNSGQSIKNIDWKLYARTDKLFVKRFEEETNLRCQLVIDQSSSMYYPTVGYSKIQFAVEAAAALVYLLKKQRDAFGLSVFSEEIDFHSEAKSTTVHQKLIFNQLEKMLKTNVQHKTGISAALHQIAENVHKRSLIILFTDTFENVGESESVFAALQHLKHNKHEVVVFNVTQKEQEVNFDFPNRPYIFVDVESGEKVKLFPDQVKEEYLKAITMHRKELETKCAQYRIDLIDADIKDGFSAVLNAYMIKRGRMR